jgi:hypothetical protein
LFDKTYGTLDSGRRVFFKAEREGEEEESLRIGRTLYVCIQGGIHGQHKLPLHVLKL